MLKNKELRVEIIQLYYNIPTARYRERWKTTELITRNYQWLEVTKNIGKYMNRCDMCQRIKNYREALVGKLMMNKVPKRS